MIIGTSATEMSPMQVQYSSCEFDHPGNFNSDTGGNDVSQEQLVDVPRYKLRGHSTRREVLINTQGRFINF